MFPTLPVRTYLYVYVLLIALLPILVIHFINALSDNVYIRFQVLHS